MKARSDTELVKEDRERLKTSPIRYDASQGAFFWEGIPDCSAEQCPIYATCQYPKIGVCGLRKRYLSVVERLVLGCMETKSPKNKLKVGFHLIPLYNQLFVAKLNCIAKETPENTREVRAILRSIEAIFKSLKKKAVIPGEETTNTPEGDYYDQMSEAGLEEAKMSAPIVSINKRKQKRGPKVKVRTSDLDKEFDIL
jgi:hypothetical protein